MLKAVIFDLDGTIIDNTAVYDFAFSQVFKRIFKKKNDKISHVGGIGLRQNWQIILSRYNLNPDYPIEKLEEETQDVYLKHLNKVKVRSGFRDLIKDLKGRGVKTALATGNDKKNTNKVIEYFSFEDYFDVVTTVYEAGMPKPNPDIFLLTLKKLDLSANECLVVEDSEAGFESSKKAGIRCLSIHEYDFVDLSFQKLQSLINTK